MEADSEVIKSLGVETNEFSDNLASSDANLKRNGNEHRQEFRPTSLLSNTIANGKECIYTMMTMQETQENIKELTTKNAYLRESKDEMA